MLQLAFLIQNKNNGPKTNMKKNVTKKKSEKIKNSKKNQKKIKKNDGHKEKKRGAWEFAAVLRWK